MMNQLVATRLTSLQQPCAGEWWALYESAFPASERRHEVMHALALSDPLFHCLHLADESGFVGLLTYWQFDDMVYVEHLAIIPERRGCGWGRAALALLDAPVILEIEPVEDETTARRLAFYASCGFSVLPYKHVQLAYQAGEADVPLVLLSRPSVDGETVAKFERLFHAHPMRYRDGANG